MKLASELPGRFFKLLIIFSLLSVQARAGNALTLESREAPSSLGRAYTPSPKLHHAKGVSTKSSLLELRAPSSTQVSLTLANNTGASGSTMSRERTMPSTAAKSTSDSCALPTVLNVSLFLGVSLMWFITLVILYVCHRVHCRRNKTNKAPSSSTTGWANSYSTKVPDAELGYPTWLAMPQSRREKQPSRTPYEPESPQKLSPVLGPDGEELAEMSNEATRFEIGGDMARAARNSRYYMR